MRLDCLVTNARGGICRIHVIVAHAIRLLSSAGIFLLTSTTDPQFERFTALYLGFRCVQVCGMHSNAPGAFECWLIRR